MIFQCRRTPSKKKHLELPTQNRNKSFGVKTCHFAVILLLLKSDIVIVESQHKESSTKYDQTISKGTSDLNEILHISSTDDLSLNELAVAPTKEGYRLSIPPIEDFVIGILVNPCGANGTYERDEDISLGHNCCVERFGQGEYSFKPGTRNRFSNGYSNGIPLTTDEPLHNIELVDEFGNELDYLYSRRAEDIIIIDESCRGLRDPHMACVTDRFAAVRSKVMPPCWDNNETVDSTLDCYTPDGIPSSNCMQVSYSQNALINVCGGKFTTNDHCGTFLEIHKADGTPYDDEATILADTKITTPANGMQTTTMPLTYKGDPGRILCSYEEIKLRVGSMVRVKDESTSCCCPPWLSSIRSSKIGGFLCPKRKEAKDGGPFAPELKTLEEKYADNIFQQEFPWCPDIEDMKKDILMCTQERVSVEGVATSDANNYFIRPCMPLVELKQKGRFSSADLSGEYSNVCPLGDVFNGCGASSFPWGECYSDDYFFFVIGLPRMNLNF